MQVLRDALADLPGTVFADLLKSEDAYLVVVDVPGATAESTSVRAESGRLHVAVDGDDERDGDFEVRREGRERPSSVDLPVPPDVDAESASASVERGVLEVRLPRSGGEATVAIE